MLGLRALREEIRELRKELEEERGNRRGALAYCVDGPPEPGSWELAPREGRRLTWDQMWQMYIRNEVVRMCVDTKKDEIASMPWEIVGRPGHDPAHLEHVQAFFENPNSEDENLQAILSKLCLDLFVFDAAVLEKVRGTTGRLVEIVNRYGPSFEPVFERGIRVGWRQNMAGRDPVEFDERDILYMMAHPNTRSPYGISPLETLVEAVAMDLLAMQFQAGFFTENEIPPGALVFPNGLDEASLRRNQEAFRQAAARQRAIRIITGDARWLRFHPTNQESQVIELQKLLIWRIAGVYRIDPTELGLIEHASRATAKTQAWTSFRKSVIPVLRLIEYHFNTEIIRAEFGYDDVLFRFVTEEHKPEVSLG